MNVPMFSPLGTVALTVGIASVAVALPTVFAGMPRVVRVLNPLTEVIWIAFGTSTVAAVVGTAVPLLPGSVEFFEIGGATTSIASITAGTGGGAWATVGQGGTN